VRFVYILASQVEVPWRRLAHQTMTNAGSVSLAFLTHLTMIDDPVLTGRMGKWCGEEGRSKRRSNSDSLCLSRISIDETFYQCANKSGGYAKTMCTKGSPTYLEGDDQLPL